MIENVRLLYNIIFQRINVIHKLRVEKNINFKVFKQFIKAKLIYINSNITLSDYQSMHQYNILRKLNILLIYDILSN
jgi:hypothetical protein